MVNPDAWGGVQNRWLALSEKEEKEKVIECDTITL
jgi:hypothetical protein